MAAPVLQLKRGLLANLPGLRVGEPGFTTDSYDLYVGIDSTTANNKFFGSHRYWTRGTATTGSGVNLVEGTNNGTDYITIKSPDTLSGIVTYTLPATNGDPSSVLTNNGNGILSWASGSNNATFTGITTFSDTTDNTLGNENTGSVHLDGGMGIAKNLTVKQNLHVGGYSEFIGVATFKGGTINLGDDTGDNINVGGEFTSGLYPNTTATYDLGDSTRQWRHLSFSGVGTFATGAVVDAVQIGITAASEIDTSSGALTLDSATGQTIIDDNLSVTGLATVGSNFAVAGVTTSQHLLVTGITTVTGDIAVNGGDVTTSATTFNLINATATNVNFAGAATALVMGAATGITTVRNKLIVGDDLEIDGNDILASDGATNITLTSNTLTTFAGDICVNGNDIQASDGNTNITMTSNTLTTFAGDIRVNGNDIQSSTGSNVITLATNNATFANDVTVNGNLYVSGNTTQVNTAALTVEDRTIDLGIVNGAAPSADTTWDLGVLFNYYTSGAAKKSAVIWEHGDSRFKFASVLGADSDGSNNNTPQLTVTTFAPIEIGALWVNDCAGQSQVISCTGSTRNLENITIDAGTF